MSMRRGLVIAALLPLMALTACGTDSDEEDATVADGSDTTGGAPADDSTAGAPDGTGDPGGTGDTGEPAPDGPPTYEYVGTVLENDDHGPELCPGMMAMSFPPQCGGVPTEGWSWAGVPGVQREAGTTWAEVRVVGTWDGRMFVPRSEARAPEPGDNFGTGPSPAEDFAPACDDHPVVDEGRVADTDFRAAVAAADRLPPVAATWLSFGHRPTEEWVLNVVVTDDAAGAEAELRPLWGGGLCVVQRDQPTEDQLTAVQEQVPEVLGEGATILSRAPDVRAGQVVVTVVAATGEMRRALDEAFGPGMVRLEGVLRPVDGPEG